MTTKRGQTQHRTDPPTDKPMVGVQPLEERRSRMHAAEGHAGSIPRANPDLEHDRVGQRRHEWDRVLGH